MPVRFISTRSSGHRTVLFSEALRQGLAPDGGLYVPTLVPALPRGWESTGSFRELADRIVSQWLEGDLPREAVQAAVASALDFPLSLVPLSGEWEGVHVLELFHGPTLSFKDFGARTMARLLAVARSAGAEAARQELLTVLVATSGDTGSAVADGFSGLPGFRVILLYPEGQVSPVQERQLVVRRPGVKALKVRGAFDDCQRMVKAAFADPELSAIPLSSANSINIGRLLPQMLYYAWAVAQVGGKPRICVPSGNLGNLTAAVLGRAAGVPAAGFLAAHNANRFFPDYLDGQETGFSPSVATLSNAMDVGAPSNFERLEWLLGKARLRELVEGEVVSDQETLASMRRVYLETGYVADPHTAVGLEGVRRRRSRWDGEPIVVASTAHPAKFPEAVEAALGFCPEEPDSLERLIDQPTRVDGIDAHPVALREFLLSE